MSTKAILISAVLFGILSWPALAYAAEPDPQTSGAVRDALLERELINRDLAYRTAPIKSKPEALSYLARNAGRKTPLDALSKGAQQRFLQSLVFTDKGLASFYYDDLRAKLTATQIYQVLALFGAQDSTKFIPGLRIIDSTDAAIADRGNQQIRTLTDYPNYKCTPPATCAPSFSTICIGSNCFIP